MAHDPDFWIFVGSFLVLFLFVGECLNAYSANTPKKTALSQVFHTVIGLIGTGIFVSVFGVSIVLCFLVVFFCLLILIMYLAVTTLEIIGLGIVVATGIGCIGFALETIVLTLVGPSRLKTTVVKNLIRTGITTYFAPLLLSLRGHRESTTAPEFPLSLTFGTGMRFYFSFRATPQKKFPPDWKPRPYWGDGLEGDFGVYPFSQKHINPVFQRRPIGNFPPTGMAKRDPFRQRNGSRPPISTR